jgi:hypothetical protein
MKTTKSNTNLDKNKVDETKARNGTDKINGDSNKGDGHKTVQKTATVALTRIRPKGSEKPTSQEGLKKWSTVQTLDETRTDRTDEESSTGNPFERSGIIARSPPNSRTSVRDERCTSCEVLGEVVVKETAAVGRLRATSERPQTGGGKDVASESGESEEDEVFVSGGAATREESAASTMHGVRLRLDKILSDPNAKFSKQAGQKIAALFSEASKLLMQLGCDNACLRGSLAERAETNRPPPATFAEAVSGPRGPRREASAGVPAIKGVKGVEPRNSDRELTVVVADNSKENRSVDMIKKALLEAVDPVATNIRIKNVRKARSGKVVVQVHSKADAAKIVENQAIKEKGLTAAPPAARKPRLILYDVPRDLEVDGVRRALIRQNTELLEGVGETTFKEECVFCFRLGKGNEDTVNWVLEVTPGMRDKLRKASRLYVGWRSCRVADFMSVTRCFRCLDVGHVARYCKVAEEVCSHCSLSGHKRDKCPNTAKPMVCAVCRRRGRPANHAVSDRGCPSYAMAINRYAGTVDHG